MEPHNVRANQNDFARTNVGFRLRLTSAPGAAVDDDQVRQAVSAWIAFGGVGMRTRRGCGALFVEQSQDGHVYAPFDTASLHGSAPATPYVPMLRGARLITSNLLQNHEIAWKSAVNQWRIARNPGQDIHDPTYTPNVRADLGLPIQSHGYQIKGTGGIDRFASPVIVKPLPVNAGQSRPMVLCLNAPHAYDDASHYSAAPPGGGPPKPIRELTLDTIKAAWGTNCQEVPL
jgi:hypothetical protein